jgi:integrase
MIIIQAGLGLRIAELLALRLEDVDFLRRTVRVEWQLTQAPRITQNTKIAPHGAIAHRGRRNPSGAYLGIRTG